MKPSTMIFLACSTLLLFSAIRDISPIGMLVALLFGLGTVAAWRGR